VTRAERRMPATSSPGGSSDPSEEDRVVGAEA
jgi:hypothetical protein